MFDENVLIDRNKLEEECASAPAFFDYWQNQEINLKADREDYDSQLSLKMRSMTDIELKTVYNISRLTEGAIMDVIKNDPESKRLKKAHMRAESERRSYEKKISMLDVLARLHGQGYFAKIESRPGTRSILAEEVRKKIADEIARQSKKPRRPKK